MAHNHHHHHHHHRRRRRFRTFGLFCVTVLPAAIIPILVAFLYQLAWDDPEMESRLNTVLLLLGVAGLIVLGVAMLRGFLDGGGRAPNARPPLRPRREPPRPRPAPPPRDPMYDPDIDGLPG
jgi:hypothetical protein